MIIMRKIYLFFFLVLLSAGLHEAGHVIVGGGATRIEYAPDIDPLSTRIYVHDWSIYSAAAGFVFTLPLLLLRVYPGALFVVMLFQSRYDFMKIYIDLFASDFDFSGFSL